MKEEVKSEVKCTYAGVEYSDGAIVCQAGTKYQCRNGNWDNLGEKCSE